MKSELEMLEERIQIYLKGKRTRNEAVQFLKGAGIEFEDNSDEAGYPNFRFWHNGEYVRAYKGSEMKEFRTQIFRKVEMKWSGIPTFEPSGKRSC